MLYGLERNDFLLTQKAQNQNQNVKNLIMVTVQFIMLKAENAMQGKLLLILTERKSVKPPTAKPNAL